MTTLSLPRKVLLAARIWALALFVVITTRLMPLPRLVALLSSRSPRGTLELAPRRLGSIVGRTLTVAGRPPRCLIAALVAYRLNRAEGHLVQLVIGLPLKPSDKDAHAWLELAGVDVGPPPGRLGHVELARYP